MIHKVVIYKIMRPSATQGRWKWRLEYNKRTICRSDYNYGSPSAAVLAFKNMVKVLTNGNLSSTHIQELNGTRKYDIIPHGHTGRKYE